MLFDPKWRKAPTLRDFIAWLRTKPADEKYNWPNQEFCACAQFWGEVYGFGSDWPLENAWVTIQEGVSLNELAGAGEWTFGALLNRARRKLAELDCV